MLTGFTTKGARELAAAVAPERLGRLVGHLSARELSDVDTALRVVLGLA